MSIQLIRQIAVFALFPWENSWFSHERAGLQKVRRYLTLSKTPMLNKRSLVVSSRLAALTHRQTSATMSREQSPLHRVKHL
jgi:hypothetical protein